MIISRAPVRIPLGGGGTDLPSYYSKFGGEWLSVAVDKYIYIVLHKRFDNKIKANYSQTDEVDSVGQIRHPIIRETLKLLGISGGIEISSFSDVPANTGLGSSGSFTVALLYCLHSFLAKEHGKEFPSRKEIAEQACHIAMNILKEPSGKQDEYIATFGGIKSFSVLQDGKVEVGALKITTQTMRELENNLLMFYTGIRRDSKDVLKIQADASQRNDQQVLENLHKVKQIGREIKVSLENGNLQNFGKLLDTHWQEKIKRQGTTDPQINSWYEKAKTAGALGGKLMGAGGGGFFLFYCDGNKENLRKEMAESGLKEYFFRFDFEGAKILADFI